MKGEEEDESGATATAIFLGNNKLLISHIGDSSVVCIIIHPYCASHKTCTMFIVERIFFLPWMCHKTNFVFLGSNVSKMCRIQMTFVS